MRTLLSAILLTSLTLCTTFASAANDPLQQAIGSRSSEAQARDQFRHPQQTLSFFKLKPGMTVAEALPGGGWYSNVLANYLGSEGTLYGLNYVDDMWPLFGFMDAEKIAERIASTAKFPALVASFSDTGPTAEGYTFSNAPSSLDGTVDRVLVIRALHNLNRFEAQAGTRSQALATMHRMLKADGMVGLVQHRAPASADDAWADGSRGYLKQSSVIETFEQAGFELVGSSEINANLKDQPGKDDIVWRLPPSYSGSRDDPALKAAVDAIGESDRMTLLFRKAS